MKNSKIMILLLAMVMILAVSAVSAADIDDSSDLAIQEVEEVSVDEVASDDVSDDILTLSENQDVVADDGDNEKGTFKDLQSKISGAEDTLDLEYNFTYTPGIDDAYVNGVVIDKGLTINGKGYTINGNNAARIFNITAATSINNLTITNGNVNSKGGAAIYATAVLNIANSNFTNNIAPLVGTYGAVHTNTGASFDNCIFTGNSARWGGAIGAEGSGTITIKNSKFENNKANQGGAIDIEGYILNIDNIEFIANEAVVNGGAIHTSLGTISVIENSKFKNNKGYQGGAIKTFDGSLTIYNSEFIANNVTGTEYPNAQTWSSGGAIWAESKMTISNTNFTDNYAEYNGAAIYYQKAANVGESLIENCKFEDNYAGSYYGAVYYYGWDSLTVKDSDFINNTADKNRAGALFFNARNLEITGGEFINNSASEGGAVYYTNMFINSAWASDDYKKLTIDGVTFKDNTASSTGGAVYINNGIPTVKNSIFDGNTANDNANSIYLNDGNLSLSGNTINSGVAEILVNNGEVNSQINITVMDNGTYKSTLQAIDLYASVTDDNGNIIQDTTFKFLVGETPVEAVYNSETKLYEATYTPSEEGNVVVSMSYDTSDLNIKTASISILREASEVTITPVSDVVLPVDGVNITFTVVGDGEITAIVTDATDDSKVISSKIADGKVVISDLTVGDYKVTIKMGETNNYTATEANMTFSVVKGTSQVTINPVDTIVLPDNSVNVTYKVVGDGAKTITVVDVNNESKVISFIDKDDKIVISDLTVGDYKVTIKMDVSDNYTAAEANMTFSVRENAQPVDVTVPELTPGKEETVTITLPENATGNITVKVDGEVKSVTKVNGTTTVSIPATSSGKHNIEIIYSGDDNYAGFTVPKDVDIKSLAKITGSKVTAYYNDGSVYKVRVLGDDGKAAVGASVVIKVNGKKVATLKTDKNGYATYKIIQTPKSSYTFTAEANGLKTTNKVVVKQVIKAKKTTKIKKSKASKIKITLKGKKVIKNTKVTVKFKGKKYTVKINKKGVGYFKIKKSVAKKLKKGKKYSYTITYKKDTLKRFVKVKK